MQRAALSHPQIREWVSSKDAHCVYYFLNFYVLLFQCLLKLIFVPVGVSSSVDSVFAKGVCVIV